jgi:hypothetical protein
MTMKRRRVLGIWRVGRASAAGIGRAAEVECPSFE